MKTFLSICLWLAVPIATIGCANPTTTLPTYPEMSESAALQILASRADSVQSLSVLGQLELTRPDGQSIRFDAAVAMRPPDDLRLRAWKFGQAVFDLTLTPQGVWLAAERNDQHKDDVLKAGVSAGEFAQGWSLFSGSFFAGPDVSARYEGKWLIVRRTRPSEPLVICHVDRATLTPRKYVMQDETGATRFTLTLGRYASVGEIVWPHRIEAVSSSGRIVFDMRELELNGELPPRAFTPPARAERVR